MNDQITTIFLFVDDVFKMMRGGCPEDIRQRMSDAQVATTAVGRSPLLRRQHGAGACMSLGPAP
jgi:hypothetical protein